MEINAVQLLTLAAKSVAANHHLFKRSVGDILSDLRLLRFDDSGVLSLIDDLISEKRPNRKKIADCLSNFNDTEWKVADAAARLVEEVGPVSNITKDDLDLIGWRKPKIREDIQRVVNFYGQ